MLYNCRRSATVVANNYCTLARLTPSDFKDITSKFPSYLQHLKEQVYLYDDPIKLFLEEQIKRIPYFHKIGVDTFHDVLFNFNQETCDKGTYIFREGEIGDSMYFISRGRVEVVSKDGNNIYATLSDGNFFGEIALLLQQPRNASIRAVDYVDLYTLDHANLEEVLQKFPEFMEHIHDLAKKRHAEIAKN
jgi:CRP-like cAMP-binding protein